MKFALTAATVVAAFISGAVAQTAGQWGQCGGNGYTGPTQCPSGWVCTPVSPPWYYQCLQGTSTTSSSSRSSSSSSRSSSSSSSSSRSTSSSSSTRSTSTSSSSTRSTSTSTATTSGSTVIPTATGNPFSGKTVWLSTYYAAEVDSAADQVSDATLKAKILKVKEIPTFTWLDTIAKVATLDDYLPAASGKIFQLVVYDLPNRDCHANASNGELFFDQGGAAKYQGYIDGIAAAVKRNPSTTVIAVIEPDSLANLVTNLSDPRCSAAADGYKSSTTYALKTLAAAGVYMYMDAGHAGWLGWPANISPAADLFVTMWTNGGKSPFIRGLATNVANYNALTAASPDPATQGNANYDETHYINALAPMLRTKGWNAQFIVDQGRSGVQNIRSAWGNWCNIKGAGFGLRPTTNTGNQYIDAIVWIKPGGESDGTSNTSATRYDTMCGGPDAKIPAPEAGQWFQAYFVDLVNNANPAF
ncbi:Exoglucanase 3; AltName: Full=1,4-beta-cellobiohydrolase 3; AltName: Full=Exocellobiohydrolase 3; Flags: Precursor [Serendipita indica DSM 11827]|uniref:Glucanase n=1 Tax=Serendipita indica (strain DSM 11827) TaxID=1109443 RepID=G4TC42_SERID|nr:Exoglucanase 3; AltName: Full=1,4-beta-cellobiohydrolase 3; AltName: Full=Exocellobiohydrolase 3; Flags: Precursor [Serendipita indica DSM 11827]CCA68892.1 probable cellulose 1,4-beta-cellobiosidase II precursor [Serendipita indica DSM 11827]